ncbi:type IV secretion system DNA-binding domain-containing protein [Cetobacterium sp. 2A]|uniref:TraG/VirB4 family ATPase n=1 Tax=Cetobacterium sp. 2A TaxID=2754723 RepID=UPI00163C3991|nr:type IV secretion system DNA-binding domain-containing protein [Cetobacterium sp. 2A]MBC2857028.1 type IV secretion system DNA-binding domain-containing protein [Cetobacterium sp. 2A]
MFYIAIIIMIVFLYMLKTDMEYDPKHKDRMTDYLPWVIPMKDGTVINKNGSITRVYKYICDDMNHQTDRMLFMYRHKLNDIFKRLDERFVVQVDSIRKNVKEYPDSNFEDEIFKELDKSRKKNYLSGKYYESENYMSITYFPPKDKENKLKSLFINSSSTTPIDDIVEKYNEELEDIIRLLKENFIEIKQLTADETVTFLYSCITSEDKKIKYIKGQYLDSYISNVDIKNDYSNMKIGNKYTSVIGVLSHIPEHECGVFDEISSLGIEYRWNSRFIYISNENAIKISEAYQKAYNSERKDFRTGMIDKALEEEVLDESSYALEMKEEASSLVNDIRKGIFKSGYYSFNIILMDEDEKKLKENIKTIMKIINNLQFVAVEETVNALESYFGTMPSNVEHGLRKPLMTTYNLLSLIPINMDWDGNKVNKHLKKEALLFCESGGNTSFKFNIHNNDVGHTAILGTTGGGKSVFLNTLAYQCKKYGSRVIIFDKGGSSRVTTRACGGNFFNIGKDKIKFQPLRYIHMESEKEWALEWVLSLLILENHQVTPSEKALIIEALGNLANVEEDRRTISALLLLIQNSQLQNIFISYTKDEEEGIYGQYFDNNQDDINDKNLWQVFEMENIFDSKMLIPMLTYLFHRLETQLFPNENTNPSEVIPTFLFLDECWIMLDNPIFSKMMKSWLKTLRKKNVSVIMATQSITDIAKSSIKDVIVESCLTKVFLPNDKIIPDSEMEKLYYDFGLNEREIGLIITGTTKKDYFIKNEGGKMIQLALTPLELAYIASSSPEDQSECETIYKTSKNLEEFNRRWKEYKNV